MKPSGFGIIVVVVALLSFRFHEAKLYTRCGLVEELLQQGFPRSFVGNWVCLIESESGKDTSKIINKADRSQALGLFQINNKRDWCSTGDRKGGRCNMKCEDLLNEDIRDDVACAKQIHGRLGFQGWDGWKRSCKGRNLPLPTNC